MAICGEQASVCGCELVRGQDGEYFPDVSRPTIDDVAALAGVARTTVSRVLNNQPNVRQEVRDTVMRAVAMLGYRVNLQARHLAGGQARRIMLLHASDFDSEPNSYFNSALELGATRAAAQGGAQLLTHVVNQHDPDATAAILASIRDDQCDCAILTPPFADDPNLLRALAGLGVRVVCVAAGAGIEQLATVIGIDDVQAGRDIGDYLIARGHRSFGFIKGLQGHQSAEGRFSGFLGALAEAGIGADAVLAERGNFTFRSGHDCAQKIFAAAPQITALVCANDDMAAGALLAAHKLGMQIPGDIAITGFDDTPVSEIVWPPLTTIHQPLRRIGARAVELLIAPTGEGGVAENSRETMPHWLVMRESSEAGAG